MVQSGRLTGLLCVQGKRLGLDAYLKSKWVKGDQSVEYSKKDMGSMVENLNRFNSNRNNFRVALVTNIAKKKFKSLTAKAKTKTKTVKAE